MRITELGPLLDALSSLDLSPFRFVSVHAPSTFAAECECDVVAMLRPIVERGWPVIVHPDAIRRHEIWMDFGPRLCIENMDKRKPVGRSVRELSAIFERLPEASLCFDIAHARQVDPSMMEAYRILRDFGDRIAQVHVSEVNVASRHVRLSRPAVRAYLEVATLVPPHVPLIIEAPVLFEEIEDELAHALEAFGRVPIAA
ncbi:MAG TPA: hypothetical protein VFQ39_15040 [Longimicrobium sp.]|nr:hypothetical protein [Longimicrobium sp.]